MIAFGSSDYAVGEALDGMNGEWAYLRLRAFPFHKSITEFIEKSERVVVVEQNQQGQMAQLLQMTYPELAAKIHSACYFGGFPLAAGFVRRALEESLARV